MIAALKIRDGRAASSRHDRPGRVSSPLSPAAFISARLTPEQCQYAEKTGMKTTRKIFLNEQKVIRKREIATWAKSDVPKVLSREIVILSESRIYKLRAGLDDVSTSSWEAIKAHRLARAHRQMAEARAVIRQSLGPLTDLYPDAIERVLDGKP